MITKEIEEVKIGDNVEVYRLSDKDAVYKTMIEDIFPGNVYQIAVPSLNMIPMRISRGDKIELAFHRASGRYVAVMYVMGIVKDGGMRSALLSQSTPFSEKQRRESYRVALKIKLQVFESAEEEQQTVGEGIIAENTGEAENLIGEKGLTDDAAATNAKEMNLTDEKGVAANTTKAIPVIENTERASVLEILSSKDISASGIAFISKMAYEPGSIHMLGLHLNETEQDQPRRNKSTDNTPSAQASSKEEPFMISAEIVRAVKLYETNSYFIGMRFDELTSSSSDRIERYIMLQQQSMMKKRSRY